MDCRRFECVKTRAQEYLKDAAELQIRIKEANESIEQNYWNAIRQVERLKKTINELERSIGKKKSGQTINEIMKQLNLAKHHLEKFSDSLILESKAIWSRYYKLENDCKEIKFESAGLEYLRFSCEKMEGLAADLLCYSLAHFKRQNE